MLPMEWRNASMRAPDSLVCVEAGAEGSDDRADGKGEERNEGGLTEEGTSGLKEEEEEEGGKSEEEEERERQKYTRRGGMQTQRLMVSTCILEHSHQRAC
jgi:hypothetical protein